MGRALAAEFPVARQAFEEADDRLGAGLLRVCFEGPADELELTENAQPAILVTSIAAFRVLRDTAGLRPGAVAGHSLGEWSALVAAGALALGDAAVAVRERGRLMQSAVPAGEGAMAAVLGLSAAEVAALCPEAAAGDVLAPANLNGGGQVVVSGHARAVERLLGLLAVRKVRARRLPVSAPFHCPLMAPAAGGLARHLDGVAFREPDVPVWTSVEARPIRGAFEVRDLLVRQLTVPVRWEDTVRGFTADAGLALEVGPGRVLTGLLRRIRPGISAAVFGEPDDLAAARTALDDVEARGSEA
jgi:[acyl-carrier-protein] S-malonyltransferase